MTGRLDRLDRENCINVQEAMVTSNLRQRDVSGENKTERQREREIDRGSAEMWRQVRKLRLVVAGRYREPKWRQITRRIANEERESERE